MAKKKDTKLAHSKDVYKRWFKDMYLMRKFEEKCGQLYIQQKFGGFCHLYIGQEAVLSGMQEALKPSDRVITAYRDHAHPLVLGTDPKVVMAELYGKVTGSSKGKGGSMHMFDKERNLFGGHGIVGGQIGLGAGIAFADKYRNEDHVTICFMGDGAARQGMLHETFNMSMIWKLPVIFVIENNQYAMGTSVKRTTNVHDLSKMGDSYDMPSETVDGMSPEAVCAAIQRAAERGRKGDGPTLLNIETYRYKGHSMSDPQKYRSKDEVKTFQDLDPITYVRNILLENKWMTEAQLKTVEKKVKITIEEAVTFAEESPKPEAHELYEDVYTQEDYPYVKD
ncbi:MAG TPA: pyruvate dehydrogenase (acetyl-transferring) E1 component subunit alpha [Flavobacteriales bacterium]|jgi:pyruvate dehydrogenase E1 component alpha subunit|nr:pyruvate dehydrogenase (acetyl-transferring) E1 component subunit alpha [Flavobacteriales bacterium]HIB76152.1 pyruvate dehydrogenase (acetyl-transferring) E1 component subunit alpha [Flavobacteriales bacterium]HIN42294.1 pyruvate dehydrogenase (acetyl-transferring) E1 component subunit alpha [Flavobacteriales bacterium]HIO15928.1 pyruvate dehydrogenase (acetyl-transferring) E1 component subunit alpha [Flavobacteriales bacterium]HIO58832.1 pyruvate dehydrogenase (acetyl-transferring) E1 comp